MLLLQCHVTIQLVLTLPACGEEINVKGDEGAIVTSPQYPQNYPNNFQCVWVVSFDASERLGVSFETFDLEPNADFLEIGVGSTPGTPTASLSKKPDDAIVLDAKTVWLRLTTDRSINRLGFKAKIREQPYNGKTKPRQVTPFHAP